ncbi:hypothetical protein U8326_00405 [Tsuneonella sp. CC-YZS046]|uniref:hypothetical protein n=1 Tax=Tsuneonella sp. CC-YZS046 TaxID=3042152 RepID=UPI002D79E91F|nr:hypothetical protein [Tsuneonella sp. CC-YZS046]WRO66662.1 hypothetical protein U8326_00405 [Tsuneonella sp. CC-YZS046]
MTSFDAKGAAEQLLAARRTLIATERLSADRTPATIEEGYKVQNFQMEKLGALGGYKAGAAPDAVERILAPIPADAVHSSGSRLNAADYRPGWVEVEFAFRILAPITETDIIGREDLKKIAEFVPVIEILATRFSDIMALTTPEIVADLGVNGAIIVGHGSGCAIPPPLEDLKIFVDGKEFCPNFMSPADPLDTCLWLINRKQAAGSVMSAGTVITTGTIIRPLTVKGNIEARFSELYYVSAMLI